MRLRAARRDRGTNGFWRSAFFVQGGPRKSAEIAFGERLRFDANSESAERSAIRAAARGGDF